MDSGRQANKKGQEMMTEAEVHEKWVAAGRPPVKIPIGESWAEDSWCERLFPDEWKLKVEANGGLDYRML